MEAAHLVDTVDHQPIIDVVLLLQIGGFSRSVSPFRNLESVRGFNSTNVSPCLSLSLEGRR
jgi:hypothetical protein